MVERDGVVDAVDLHGLHQGTVDPCDIVGESGDFFRRLPQVSFLVVEYGFHVGIDRDKLVDNGVAMEKDTATEEIAEGKEAGGTKEFHCSFNKKL